MHVQRSARFFAASVSKYHHWDRLFSKGCCPAPALRSCASLPCRKPPARKARSTGLECKNGRSIFVIAHLRHEIGSRGFRNHSAVDCSVGIRLCARESVRHDRCRKHCRKHAGVGLGPSVLPRKSRCGLSSDVLQSLSRVLRFNASAARFNATSPGGRTLLDAPATDWDGYRTIQADPNLAASLAKHINRHSSDSSGFGCNSPLISFH